MAVYLDYNASAPIDERVLERMIEVYRSHYGNADSRTHIFGTDAKEIVSSARKTIAEILAVDSTDVFFTSGSTESNNMAILGLLDYALESGRNHFITTSIEHKSVLEAMKHLQEKGCVVDFVSPDASGRMTLASAPTLLPIINRQKTITRTAALCIRFLIVFLPLRMNISLQKTYISTYIIACFLPSEKYQIKMKHT